MRGSDMTRWPSRVSAHGAISSASLRSSSSRRTSATCRSKVSRIDAHVSGPSAARPALSLRSYDSRSRGWSRPQRGICARWLARPPRSNDSFVRPPRERRRRGRARARGASPPSRDRTRAEASPARPSHARGRLLAAAEIHLRARPWRSAGASKYGYSLKPNIFAVTLAGNGAAACCTPAPARCSASRSVPAGSRCRRARPCRRAKFASDFSCG